MRNYDRVSVGDLVEYTSPVFQDYRALGIVTEIEGGVLHAHWSDERIDEINCVLDSSNITGHWKVINFEEEAKMKNTDELKIGFEWEPKPKKKEPTFKAGDIVVVTSVRERDSHGHKKALGSELTVSSLGMYYEGDDGQWYDLIRDDGYHFYFPECNLTLKSDLVEDLPVAQEAANFGYQAVQGIINAHAEKNREASEDCDCYSNGNHFKCCGKEFTFSDFDKSVSRTWKDQDFNDAVTNAALGLTGEAGEVADLIKKAEYHGRGWRNCGGGERSISEEDVKDELSDVLFYVSAMAQEFGFTLEDVARHNKEKLEKRFPEGFSTKASAQKKDKH